MRSITDAKQFGCFLFADAGPGEIRSYGGVSGASPGQESGDGRGGNAPASILVVDDHPPSVALLAQHLAALGYEVATATTGPEALECIAGRKPDVVLLDIGMPEMSGLDVLRRLRADPATADLPVILVSGRDATEEIVSGLKLGAYDYVTKPINIPILEARLETRTLLKRSRDELKQMTRRQAAELERTALDLRVAGQVQRAILPRTPPRTDAVAVAWDYKPITEVGGDLFDVIPLPGGRTLLFVADAMGHGVQAALVAAAVKATLATHLQEAGNLSMLMGVLDSAVAALFADRFLTFVTAAACVIDPAAGTLHHAMAGHPPVLVSGREGVDALHNGGLPLGMNRGMGIEEHEIALDPDAAILLFTDGLTEAYNPSRAHFGLNRLVETFARHRSAEPDAMVRGIRAALEEFRGPVPLEDDLTLLAARLHPVTGHDARESRA